MFCIKQPDAYAKTPGRDKLLAGGFLYLLFVLGGQVKQS